MDEPKETVPKRFKITKITKYGSVVPSRWSLIDFYIQDNIANRDLVITVKKEEFIDYLAKGNKELLDVVFQKIREFDAAVVVNTFNWDEGIGVEF